MELKHSIFYILFATEQPLAQRFRSIFQDLPTGKSVKCFISKKYLHIDSLLEQSEHFSSTQKWNGLFFKLLS